MFEVHTKGKRLKYKQVNLSRGCVAYEKCKKKGANG